MRSDRLKDTELSKVEEHFREHPLFTACQRAFKSYQANMAPLLFAHGEVFYEAAIIIDYLHQIPQTDEVKTYIADLWNDLRIKLSKWEKTASPKNLDMAVSSVLYTVAMAMNRHWTTFYYSDVTRWLLQAMMDNMNVDYQEMMRVFGIFLDESDRIEDWVNNIYDGHLSEEIETTIKGQVSSTNVPKPGRGRKSIDLKNVVGTFNYEYYDNDRGTRLQLFYEVLKLKYIMNDTDQKGFIDLFQNTTTNFKVVWIKEIVALKYLINKIEKWMKVPQGHTKWQITCAHFQYREKQNNTVDNKKIYSYIVKDLKPTQFVKGKKQPDKIEDLDKIISILDPQTDYRRAYQEYLDVKEEHDEVKDIKDALAHGLSTDIKV